ncbi:hypothetical protein [Pseudonocardia sp. WMMC193]|uniref:hypothetical protein n=1 Tax=Pseudonocardia sp. WMMC193 TaxID=2911965 RepID=UPI001F297FE2|nr:hypothetical protein [Pseudonocardia sp. WMMC193]MCF7553433.1 hypothetical protein [Pseudonocardia sp. WMMC193]
MKRTLIVSGVLVAGLAAGSGIALADGGSTAPPTTSSAAPSSGSEAICTQRIPKALDRVGRLIARIEGDASTTGSTAALQARAAKARAAGRTALADLLDARVQDRPQRLQDLQDLQHQLTDIQTRDCGK